MPQNRIAVVAAIIFIAFVTTYSAWYDLSTDRQKLGNIRAVENRFQEIIGIDAIISGLQKERGLTAVSAADPNGNYAAALLAQRQNTAHLLKNFAKTADIPQLNKNYDHLLYQMETLGTDQNEIFQNYTLLIEEAMQKSDGLFFGIESSEARDLLSIYQFLKSAQENADRLFARIGAVLATNLLSEQNHQEIIALNALYQHQIMKAQADQRPILRPLLNDFQNQGCVQQILPFIQNVMNRSTDISLLKPADWFQRSSCALTHLHTAALQQLELTRTTLSESAEDVKSAMIRHLIFWSGSISALSFLLVISFIRSKALARGHKLLEHYQDAIDYSTIVSKADKQGVITYVNRAFCEISGYSPKELLHQPHNIVRHPDMPPEVFQVMWSDLKKGKKWNGIIKNLKKDGTAYWVDASISPIYDHKGQFVEYIAIRRDITDMILLNEEIKETQGELIYRMGEAVESRSKESGHHIQRVAHYSMLLAQLAGLSEEECKIIFAASTMHDIGKISISDAILLKEGELNEQEWAVMKTHAETGYKILKGSERPLLNIAATVAYEHHEHFDGNGYPRGIKGDEISIYGRIVAVADVFDALSTERIYKQAWPMETTLAYLTSQSGKQFDPELITLFINYVDQFMEIKNRFIDKKTRWTFPDQ